MSAPKMGPHLFDGGPLDGTRMAKAIADTVPEENQRVRMEEWRAALKRRVQARLEANDEQAP